MGAESTRRSYSNQGSLNTSPTTTEFILCLTQLFFNNGAFIPFPLINRSMMFSSLALRSPRRSMLCWPRASGTPRDTTTSSVTLLSSKQYQYLPLLLDLFFLLFPIPLSPYTFKNNSLLLRPSLFFLALFLINKQQLQQQQHIHTHDPHSLLKNKETKSYVESMSFFFCYFPYPRVEWE